MKRQISFLLFCSAGLFFLFITPQIVSGQALINRREQASTLDPTRTAVAAATPTTTPLVANPSTLPTDQVIDLYKQALEISQNAVTDVHDSTNIVLGVVGFVFTAMSLGIAVGTWLIGNTISKSAEQLEKAREQIIKKQEEFDQRAKELTSTQEKLLDQVKSAQAEVVQFRTELSQEKSNREKDRAILKRPLTLVQIDEYGIQLIDGNEMERSSSISALIEMSTRLDSVVRLKSVRTLGVLETYDERVIKHLKEIMETDAVQSVKKEAEKSLKLIEAKKPKKPTRRKS